jgi:DNA-binding transcriptional LysR family regulator
MRALEERLGLRLLARTTRSVSPTEAGERLLRSLRPAFEDISSGLAALSELREKPAGTIRITTSKYAATAILRPALSRFLPNYPDVQVEITIDEGFTDIVAGRYDAGVRLGEEVEKDMIAVRISPDIRSAVVGSSAYFAAHPKPCSPHDLADHNCITYRMATAGGLYPWEFEKKGQPVAVRVTGSLIFNDVDLIVAAALEGQGLAFLFEGQVAGHLAEGQLIQVLADWCPPFPGFYLYYPSRRQTPPAMAALVEALRYRA